MQSRASGRHCALRAPTLFLVRMKSASVPKTRLWIKTTTAWVCLYPRSSIARGCAFHPCAIEDPRGRDAVRASAAAAVRTTPVYLGIIDEQPLRAARANLDFGTDEKRIRTKIKVMDKSNDGLGLPLSAQAESRMPISRV